MYSDKITGANIRNARLYKNYSQEYLGKKLNISQNAYSKLELGYTKFTLGRLKIIAEVLDMDVTTLIEPPGLNTDVEAISRIPMVAKLLETICKTTGMGFAAIARVTENKWIACSVLDKIEFGLVAGSELRLETTLCNEIRQTNKAIIIDDVDEDTAFRDHHTPALYGFKSYISVPIIRQDGTFFGTLCAIDPKPARLNNAEVISMFTSFSELISYHLGAIDQIADNGAGDLKLIA